MQIKVDTLALASIRIDGGTQPRASLDESVITDYAQAMQDGDQFPPVMVFYDGSEYWLADGFHRYSATKKIGLDSITADIKQGTQENAIEWSCGANATHGLRRTDGDKKRAIERLITLPKWQHRTQAEIAKQCNADQSYVSKILKTLNYDSHKNTVNQPVEPEEDKSEVRLAAIWEEKRRSVENFFDEFPHLAALSNREIAKRCDVDEKLVRKIRRERDDKLSQEKQIIPIEDALHALIAQNETEQEKEEEQQQGPINEDVSSEYLNAKKKLDLLQEEPPQTPIPQKKAGEQAPLGNIEAEPKTPEVEATQENIETEKLPKIEPSEEVKREREIRREQKKEQIEELRSKGADLPTGKYSCLIIDPPWDMQKIEREERPNQFEFDYPTMSEEELKLFPLPDLAADDCHLYLWATQKYLPLALDLAKHWGFKYQCLMTWVKNVGFTPFSWMYTTEHVLFCTKGNLPLLKIGERLDFSAKVREHSRKPDEFYSVVRKVSPGPRIDIFSREKREGFDQYGNEVGKFVLTK